MELEEQQQSSRHLYADDLIGISNDESRKQHSNFVIRPATHRPTHDLADPLDIKSLERPVNIELEDPW